MYLQYCSVCEGYKAPRSHHCRKCGRCVMKMDHHCPWLNCVSIIILWHSWLVCCHDSCNLIWSIIIINIFITFFLFYSNSVLAGIIMPISQHFSYSPLLAVCNRPLFSELLSGMESIGHGMIYLYYYSIQNHYHFSIGRYIYSGLPHLVRVNFGLTSLILCIFNLGLSVGVVVAVGMLLFFQVLLYQN